MPTTTIRLPEDLKVRISLAADKMGSTAHGFILDAIAEKIDQVERRDQFHEEAEQRLAKFTETGKSIPWDEMRNYLKSRVTGTPAKRPKPRKLAR